MSRRSFPVHHWPVTRYLEPTVIFLTVCTVRRRRLLARPAVHDLLRQAWAAGTAWHVGRYVILPDHIHLFCSPGEDVSLLAWVGYWKSYASRRWPWPHEHPIWQRDCWDTQLRGDETYEAKWEYVRCNPVRHGLAATPDAWPYAGDLGELD